MTFGDSVLLWYDRFTARTRQTYRYPMPYDPRRPQRPEDRRTLTEQDIASFDVTQTPPQNMDMVRAALKSRNPVRFNRMQRDMKWIRNRMVKMGLNPEDAPWLL